MKLQKMNLYHGFKDQKELMEYTEKFSGDELRILMLGIALTWNTIANMLEDQEK